MSWTRVNVPPPICFILTVTQVGLILLEQVTWKVASGQQEAADEVDKVDVKIVILSQALLIPL